MQEYSLKVLKWRAGDVKALYRAGVATLELGDVQTARQYLLQASRGKPNGKKNYFFLKIHRKSLFLVLKLPPSVFVNIRAK